MPYKYVTNYTVNGSPTVDSNYIASGFSSSNYFTKPSAFMPSTSTWEICFKVKTSSTLGVQNFLLGSTPQYYYTVGGELMSNNYFGFGFSSNGSSWNIGWVSGTTQVSANTWYWIRISFDGTTYKFELSTDGENYNLEGSITNSNAIYQNSTNSIMNLGTMGNRNTYWRGDIDLKEWYIKEDGQITWQAVSCFDVSGSIDITKGYYNDGNHTIIMPAGNHSLSDLTTGQTLGGKNNLFATSYNDVAKPLMSSLNAPTGTYDVYANLNHPVYLSYEKNYIAGDKLMSGVAWSFENGGEAITDYTVVGSPTVSATYILQNLSNSSYLKFTSPIVAGDISEIVFKVKTPATLSTNDDPIFTFGASSGDIFLEGSTKKFCQWNGSAKDSGTTIATADTEYIVKLVYDGSSYKLYVDDVLQFTTSRSIARSGDIRIGNFWDSSYWHGTIDLPNCYITKNGTEVWRAVTIIPASVSAPKSLLYNTTQDATYWLPSAQTVLLSSLTSSDLLTRNNLYLTNTTGSDVSAFTFRRNAPSTTEYWQQPEYVYLTQDKTQILGVGTEPDEIVLEAIDSDSDNILDTVSVSSEHYWSYYGLPSNPRAGSITFGYQVYGNIANPRNLPNKASQLPTTGTIGTTCKLLMNCGAAIYGGGNLTMHEDNLQRSVSSASYYYTGYTITFTDTTHAEIQSLVKTGTKVRIYAGISDSSLSPKEVSCLAVTKEQYNAGIPENTNLKYSKEENSNVAFPCEMTNQVTVGSGLTYDSGTDTFSNTGSVISQNTFTLKYMGDFYVDI